MFNPDLARIINSDEIQSKVRPAKPGFSKPAQKRNPLVNLGAMLKLNPYVGQVKRAEQAAQKANESKKRKLSAQPVKNVGTVSKKAKNNNATKFSETLRSTPETPASAFLDSYNAVEEINASAKTTSKK